MDPYLYNRDGGSNPKEQSKEVRNEKNVVCGKQVLQCIRGSKWKNPIKQKDMYK